MRGQTVIAVMAFFVVAVTAAAYAITVNLPPILPAGQQSTSSMGASFVAHGAHFAPGDRITFTLSNAGQYDIVAPCTLVIERLEGRDWHLVAPASDCPGTPPRLPNGTSMDYAWVAQSLAGYDAVVPGQYRAIAKIEQATIAFSLIVGFTLA